MRIWRDLLVAIICMVILCFCGLIVLEHMTRMRVQETFDSWNSKAKKAVRRDVAVARP